MNWFAFFLCSLPAGFLGVISGGYIGKLCIRGYQLHGADGTTYLYAVEFRLIDGILGLAAGLATAWKFAPPDMAGGLRPAAASSGAVLTFALVALGVCRYFAHIPPIIDRQELTLQIELRLPPGQAKPALPTKDSNDSYTKVATYFYLISESNVIGPAARGLF